MANFTTEEIREHMSDAKNIRNMSVIAHVDHGKSTLTDSLIAAAGIISMGRAGEARATDTRQDEQDRGITIKSTGISLYYETDVLTPGDKKGYLINLIDSPGHVDFSSEVTAALRVTDGSLVVVDCISGVSVQTETVLRQSLTERVKPVLFLNKLDRVLLELHLDPEEAYQSFCRNIENINVLIDTYQDGTFDGYQVDPLNGTVGFGAGLHGWGFTLTHFAHLYASKSGQDPAKLLKRLWGNAFYDADEKKWVKKAVSASGKKLKRGFVQYIMEPIMMLSDAIMQGEKDKYMKIIQSVGIKLSTDELELQHKQLLKRVMQRWLPAAEALLEMIVVHLPSPVTAQAYRYEHLYEGPLDDECATAIKKCDVDGPLMLYISKMVPTNQAGRFYAFGRVFSGMVKTGQKVRILGPEYRPGNKKDLFVKPIQRTVIMMGGSAEAVDDIPAGNTCGLVGIDQYILKTGTITDHEDAYPIRPMKFSVSPVVRVAVTVSKPADLPKLVEGLKRLSKSDPCVQCTTEENEHIVAGAGELHLEICLKDLEEDYCKCPLIVSNPVVSYRETVTAASERSVMAKSANKHNRLHVICEPLSQELVVAIEEGEVDPLADPKIRAKQLVDDFNFDKNDSQRVWSFGPELKGPNMLVDACSGVQYLNEVKDSCASGFQVMTQSGVLAEEPLVGGLFKIVDATLHSDSVHRGGGQIIPMARRVFMAAQLLAQPRFLEPVYMVDISAPEEVLGGIYSVLNNRRGQVVEDNIREGTPLHQIKAHLPVAESFGFDKDLRSNTSGKAFPQCSFDHWAIMEADPLMTGTKTQALLLDIRKRKGLKVEVPSLASYEDKL